MFGLQCIDSLTNVCYNKKNERSQNMFDAEAYARVFPRTAKKAEPEQAVATFAETDETIEVTEPVRNSEHNEPKGEDE